MDQEEYQKQLALSAMKWYGWGSPIGLTIFFLGVSSSIFIICKTFFS